MDIIVNGYNIWNILIITFLGSLLFTLITKRIAEHIGAMDIPNKRKIHKVPMPRIGGLAIFISFLLGYMLYGTISTQMISVLIGGFIIILTGLIDDIKPISPKYKLLGQLVAACIVVIYGHLYFSNIKMFSLTLMLPQSVNMALSIFFIVAVVNAINLIDGLDGLASGISSIYFITIAILGIFMNKLGGLDIILSVIMLGSTLGFLVHNFPPAKVFMGDTGSMFLGFMIAVIALLGYKATTITSVIIPIIILFIPILDTLFAIIRRLLKKESISTPDREHIQHQLLRMTASPTKSVIIIYVINAIFSAVSILYVLGDTQIATILYVILMIVFAVIVAKTNILFTHKKK